jgi:hypothetical protein
MPQTATTGNLASAQRTVIRSARYTAEFNSPSWQLIDKVQLERGASTVTMPKVGQYVISDLVDGQDMVDEQAIGMTTVDLTSTERGAKIIVTDKLVRQNGTTSIFTIVGRQFGRAAARKQDRDTQALYAGLNGGTVFGESSAILNLDHFAATIVKARGGGRTSTDELDGEPFDPDYAVHHPHGVFSVTRAATAIGAATSMRVNDRREEKMLQRFFRISFNGVDLFESGNLGIDSSGDAIGVIAERGALVGLTSVGWRTERERDASRRAWELNHVADYGVFELDDERGAPMLFAADSPTDTG